jgi:PQQ-dependent catabolism-associated beta-propeller protein
MRAPELWIALLRIVVGAWFLKAVWTKLTVAFAWGTLPYIAVAPRFVGFQPKRIAEFAAGNPVGWYRHFLEDVVLPHAGLFATLQAYAEVIVGVALLVGFCVGLSALLGLFLTINYGLATQWMSFGQQGFHLLLITSMVIFLGARAGQAWGLDGVFLRATPRQRRRYLTATAALVLVAIALSVSGTAWGAELRVLVTNEKSDNVTVLQAITHKLLGTISVGQRPRGIAVSRDGRRIFVANSNSNNLSVIDSKTLKVLDTLPAGVDPEGMTVDQRGLIYVVNENASALTIIDPQRREIVKRLEVGTEPETAVVSADGRWVAVSNETSNEIHFIDTATATIIGKLSVPANPRGMRFSADSRRLFVASEKANTISLIDVATRKLIKSVPTGGERPVDVLLCADEARLYISHGASGDVRVMEAATLDFVTSIPVGPRAWWMAQTPDKKLIYVTVGRANQIAAIDVDTNKVAARITAGTLPWGVAIATLD